MAIGSCIDYNLRTQNIYFYIAIFFIYLFDGTISIEYIFAFIFIAIGLFVYGKEPLRRKYDESTNHSSNDYEHIKGLIINDEEKHSSIPIKNDHTPRKEDEF